jgi:hypothetical protein
MEKNMKRCDWCGEQYQELWPLENREASWPGLFVWVCEECKETMQGEYWAFCSPVVFRLHRKYPAAREVHQLTEWMESVL